MKNKFHRAQVLLISLVSLTLLFSIVACKPNNPFVETEISGETVIDTNEREFIFEKPFKPRRQVVRVCFEYTDKLLVFSISEPPRFADGSPLKLTASVFDQNGKKYDLSHISGSDKNILCVSPELTDEWMNIAEKDVSFIKLIVSSNRKINVSKIKWDSFNTWDI